MLPKIKKPKAIKDVKMENIRMESSRLKEILKTYLYSNEEYVKSPREVRKILSKIPKEEKLSDEIVEMRR